MIWYHKFVNNWLSFEYEFLMKYIINAKSIWYLESDLKKNSQSTL